MTPVDAFMAVPVCIGLCLLVGVAGEAVGRWRLGRRGIRTTATVIDHVVTRTRRVGAPVAEQPVPYERRYVVAEFEYGPGRLMRIAEPCTRPIPVGGRLEVAYLPDEPDNARLQVTATAFARTVGIRTLVGLVCLVPVLGFVGR